MIVTILIILIFLTIYFLPSILAQVNHKKDILSVILINLFIGWTGLGWFIALYLAIRRDRFIIEYK